MLSDLYKEKAQFDYYRALIAIKAGNDHEASIALHAARHTVLGGKYFVELSDEDVQQIDPALTEKSFYALYGDYGYKANPIGKAERISWVPQKLTAMVDRHFAQFSEQFGDITANPMRLKTWDEYRDSKPAAPTADAGVA